MSVQSCCRKGQIQPQSLREPLLHSAVSSGRTYLVHLALDNGADLEEIDDDGYTPLALACMKGSTTAMVEMLVNCGAALESKDYDGSTPLLISARYGRPETIQLLLSKGADKDATNE